MEKPIEMIYLQSVANTYSCQLAIVYGRLLYLTQEGKIPCYLSNDAIMKITGCSKGTMLKIVQTLVNEKLVFKQTDFSVKVKDRTKIRTFTINTNHPIFINYFGKSAKG